MIWSINPVAKTMLDLRKVRKNGLHLGFQWPLKVGPTMVYLDWNSTPLERRTYDKTL